MDRIPVPEYLKPMMPGLEAEAHRLQIQSSQLIRAECMADFRQHPMVEKWIESYGTMAGLMFVLGAGYATTCFNEAIRQASQTAKK